MILGDMNKKAHGVLAALAVCCSVLTAGAQKKDQIVKPMAGPRATPLQVTPIYINPNATSQRLDKVQIGREMVVSDRSGEWLRVYANTDIEAMHSDRDEPWVGDDDNKVQ